MCDDCFSWCRNDAVDRGQPVPVSLFLHAPEPTRGPRGSPQLRHEAPGTGSRRRARRRGGAASPRRHRRACGDDGSASTPRDGRDARPSASTPPPPTDCCASRWSSARVPRVRAQSRRLARTDPGHPAGRPLPGGARRPAQRGGTRFPAAARATWWWAPTTTPRTSPDSWAPWTAHRARRSRVQLARTIRPRHPAAIRGLRALRRRGEPARHARRARFEQEGLRGSRVAAPRFRDARAMVLLDYVGDRRLRIPREGSSNVALWRKLRSAARRAGRGSAFPPSPPAASSTIISHSSSQGVPPST